jgi:hypothetical protein
MAIFQLEIADADVQRVFDAVCSNYGWQSELANPLYSLAQTFNEEDGTPILPVVDENGVEIPEILENPESQGDFTHGKVRGFLSDHVIAYELNQAKEAAAAAVDTNVAISDPEA